MIYNILYIHICCNCKVYQNPNDTLQIEDLCSRASAFIPPSRSLWCWSPTFKGPAARMVCPASSCTSERACGTRQSTRQHFAVKIQIIGQKFTNISSLTFPPSTLFLIRSSHAHISVQSKIQLTDLTTITVFLSTHLCIGSSLALQETSVPGSWEHRPAL